MFAPKKTIPKLAATGLILTSVGCGGDGGSDAAKLTEVFQDTCRLEQECDPDGFAQD